MCPTRVVRRRRPERPIADQPRDRPSTASTSFVLDGGGDLDGEPSSGRILIVTVTGTVDSVDSEVVRRVLAQPLDGERRGRGARDSAGLLPLVFRNDVACNRRTAVAVRRTPLQRHAVGREKRSRRC